VNGNITANRVAKWNGTTWSYLGTSSSVNGLNGDCNSLVVDSSNNLYAGGNFTTANGLTANYVAKWDGSTWSYLGTSLSVNGFNGYCNSVIVKNKILYAAGVFSMANGSTANYVAVYK
jgi:hypothetical protein